MATRHSPTEFVAEAVSTEPAPGPDDCWPLTARDTEMDDITAALLRGRSVLLVGETGVGKSRLLQAALRRAAAQSGNVARVAAVRGTRMSGQHALDSWLACPPGGDDPVVLGIDNAHAIDDESAERLHHLAGFCRISWLISVRSDAPKALAIDKLWVERLAERIEVKPFGESDAADVVRARLRGHVEPGTARRLHQATLGNGLFLRELVDHALAEDSLRLVAGVWRWSGPASMSGRLRDIVRLRLGDLETAEAELVDMWRWPRRWRRTCR